MKTLINFFSPRTFLILGVIITLAGMTMFLVDLENLGMSGLIGTWTGGIITEMSRRKIKEKQNLNP